MKQHCLTGTGGVPVAQDALAQPVQQKSQVVKPGEKRSKRGKRKAAVIGEPPPLAPDDYVRQPPGPKKGEVRLIQMLLD